VGGQVLSGFLQGTLGDAGASVRVKHWKINLLVVRVEVDEEIVDYIQHLLGSGVVPIDLVDDDDDPESALQRLAEDKASLWQRSLGGVHEQDRAINHHQGPLHLASEINVSGGVEDVDLDPVPLDRAVL